jgi:hypothetical protein
MEKIQVKTAVIIALLATVFGSLVVSSIVTARTGIMAGTSSAVFSKAHGTDWVYLSFGDLLPIMEIELPYIGSWLYYKVECDGYLISDTALCAFAIAKDIPSYADASTFRFYGDVTKYGYATGIHTERVYYLGPADHSFYFLGSILMIGPEPEAVCNYMSITVTVYTHGNLEEPYAEYEINLDSAKLYEP